MSFQFLSLPFSTGSAVSTGGRKKKLLSLVLFSAFSRPLPEAQAAALVIPASNDSPTHSDDCNTRTLMEGKYIVGLRFDNDEDG